MGKAKFLYARARKSVVSAARGETTRRRRRGTLVRNLSLASEHYDNVFEVRVRIPDQLILEIQDDGDDMLTVTSASGETYEISAETFLVLTGCEWTECVEKGSD